MTTGTEITSVAFDYSTLPADVAAEAMATAKSIRNRTRFVIVSVGDSLTKIKMRLPHGMFGKWLSAEFGWTERTAQNYMSAAALASKCETVSVLRPKTLYLLAAPATPEPVRQVVIDRFNAGEVIPDRAIKEMVNDARYEAQETARKTEQAARLSTLSPSASAQRTRSQREKERAERDAEREREQLEREANTQEVARILAERLLPAELDRIAEWTTRHAVYWDAAVEQAKKLAAEVTP
jgi:hypothetical protein